MDGINKYLKIEQKLISISKILLMLLLLFIAVQFDLHSQNSWTQKADFGGGKVIKKSNNPPLHNLLALIVLMPSSTPTLTTTSITSISTTSASSGGNISSDGGDAVSARGLVWSASSNTPTTSSYYGITSNSTGTGSFTQTLNALCPGTTYYVRAYSTNSIGTSYGATEAFTTTASAGDIWVQKSSFPNGARYQTSDFVIDDKIYIGMGTTGFVNYDDLWEYDIFADTWTQKTSFPNGLIASTINFAINGKGYVCGGVIGGTWQKTVFEYDPSSNTWLQKGDLPLSGAFANRANGLGLANSSRGFIIGGFDCSTGRTYTEIIEYNPNTDTWIQRANFHDRISRQPSGFVVDENLYVYATGNCASARENSFFCFNTTTNTWTSKADYPGIASTNGIGFAIGKKGYIGTGREESLAVSQGLYEYDIATDRWFQVTDIPTAGTEYADAISIGNKAYFGLGAGIAVDWYEYTPSKIPKFFVSEASNISYRTAKFEADYDVNFNACSTLPITDKGFVWHTSSNPTTSTNTGSYSAGTGTADYTANISTLDHSTTYYVRAYTSTSQGTVYGNEISFSTAVPSAPSVKTDTATKISTFSASSGGYDIIENGEAIIAKGVVWSTSPNPSIANDSTIAGADTTSFSSNLTNLQSGTKYYYRAYATNSVGTSYGQELTFTTISERDSDNDGVADDIENLGPNGGDGNGDGILDSEQEFVTTIAINLADEYSSRTTSGNSEYEYLTIEVSSCTKIFSVQTHRKIESDNYSFPAGIVEFELPCNSAKVKLIYHSIRDWSGYVYRKLTSENLWINYKSAKFDTERVGGRIVGTITLSLEDGGLGDYDGKVNGRIVDPGGPALVSNVAINVPLWDIYWRIIVISALIIIPIWWLRRK